MGLYRLGPLIADLGEVIMATLSSLPATDHRRAAPALGDGVEGHALAYQVIGVWTLRSGSPAPPGGAAQRTALASTRWTPSWWKIGYFWSPGLK